jgi:O-antigen/teichoic acid export membrane protein/2-polyprenyl-3-methyl-5-hydroxy-6-metoxy-1,4-benzoquinol methylase
MSLLKRAAYGFAWNHVGRVVEYLLMYAVTVMIARGLGAEMNGIYALFLSFAQILLVSSSFGLETSVAANLPRLLRESSREGHRAILRGLFRARLLSLLVVITLSMSFHAALTQLFNMPKLLIDYFFVLVVYYSFRSVVSLLTSFHIAKLETRSIAGIAIAVRMLEVLGVGYLVVSGHGLGDVLVLITATAVLQVVGFGLSLRSELLGPAAHVNVRPMLIMGGKFWANGLLEFLLGRQATMILLTYFLVGTEVIGHCDVAMGFAQVINFGMTTGLYGVSISSFATVAASNEKFLPSYWEFLSRMVVIAVVPALVFAAFFAELLVPAVYSLEYMPSVTLFQIFVVFLILTRLLSGGIAADYFVGSGRTRLLLGASATSGTINVLLAFLLIPRFGGTGAVFASGVAALAMAGIHGFYSRKLLNIRFPLKTGFSVIATSVGSAVVADVSVSALFGLNLFWFFIFYCSFFVFISYLIKPLSEEDAKFFQNVSERVSTIVHHFVRVRAVAHLDKPVSRLTDRQKWAFSWMPRSHIVVDIGSSSGPICTVLNHKADITIAIDTDHEALLKINENSSAVHPIRSSALHLPVRSGSVDTALLLDVLEHTSDERKVIDELHRVLRPGGTLLLSVPNKGLFSFLDPQNLSARLRGTLTPATLHRHYSEGDIQQFLSFRFTMRKRHYGGLVLYPVAFAADNFTRKHFHCDCSRFLRRLGDIDNDISWGRLSYNMIIMAQKANCMITR